MDVVTAPNSPAATAAGPAMSRAKVVRTTSAAFSILVALVLLAGYLGYRGSNRIKDTAEVLVREHLIQTPREEEVQVQLVRETQNLVDDLGAILALCVLFAAGTAGLSAWILQRAFAKLEWQGAELAHVSWHLIDGHEKMARRFSHEMHDELGQSLSGLRRMFSRVSANELDSVRPELLEIVDEVIQSVRKLSQVLRPVILDDFGLDAGLRWLCERFTQRTQIAVEYSSNFNGRMADSEETNLFRITQEALSNIARHSEATRAWVSLQVAGARIRLEITDNGRGLSPTPEKQSSLGMVGMRARARHLDGEFMVKNRKESGLQIVVEAPLRHVTADADQEDSNFVG